MRFAFAADASSPFLDDLAAALAREIASRGHELFPGTSPERVPPDVDAVFNVTDARQPRPNFFRRSPSQFICTLAETASPGDDLRREAYRVLVKTMSNVVAYCVHDSGRPATYLVTPELGFRELPHGRELARRIAEQVLAIADVRFVIENDLVEDLPAELYGGDAATRSIARVGKKLDGLGLLPSVLPLDQILNERERRMLFALFGVKQLSYGNLSARRDGASFWMTGRGANKGRLQGVGRDILLVSGCDPERRAIRLSVPRGTDPTVRVSVDAIEHWGIYREFPAVGAILHVHAWLPGIDSTLQSYPCGTFELAEEVLALVRRAADPNNAVVGLRNHGITATGPDLDTIYERVVPRLERRVPMI